MTDNTYNLGLRAMERFTNKIVVLDNGCWQWQGSLATGGYGYLNIGSATILVHRFAYIVYNGDIPEGLHIDHLCRNRGCVNPEHLEAVTKKENTLRGMGVTAQFARRTHCNKGHEYTPENTYITVVFKRAGARICRTCKREFMRNYQPEYRRRKCTTK